jgi:hypothetical protein
LRAEIDGSKHGEFSSVRFEGSRGGRDDSNDNIGIGGRRKGKKQKREAWRVNFP